MKRKLPPLPSDMRGALTQMRRCARTINRAVGDYVDASERLKYYTANKLQSTASQRSKTAMLRGRLRKHIERWLTRAHELGELLPADLRERSRALAICTQEIFARCERIPLKDFWQGDVSCRRLNEIARDLGA